MHLRRAGLGGQGQHLRAPGLHLHYVAHSLVEQRHVGGGGDDRRPLLDEGDGAVLQLAGGIGLRVDVGDLLELQAALQRQGVVQIAADEEDLVVTGQLPGGGTDVRRVGQYFLHLGGQRLDAPHHGAVRLQIHGAHHITEIQPQQVQHHHLGAVGLGGGHGDLRACPGVQHAVRLSCHGGADHIDDCQRTDSFALGLTQCSQAVCRFS